MNKAFVISAIMALAAVPALTQAQTTTAPSAPVYTAPSATAPGAPPAGGPGGGPPHQHEEHHPEMHKALHELEHAKESLQKAAHDYSGHRDQAIALIEQAEAQIQQGLASER